MDGDGETLQSALSIRSALLVLLAAAAGALAATLVLPSWLPGLSISLIGPEPKAYWLLSRSSAFVSYSLLWLAMIFGLLITSRTARLWLGGPVAFDLHQHASLLGLAFALFHALILLGDSYMAYSLPQLLIPFASAAYRPVWVGLGQIALYLMALVWMSFYLRPLIGQRTWRLLHFLSFTLFLLALAHAIWSGTDSAQPWVRGFYWCTGGSVLFLTTFRVLLSVFGASGRTGRAEIFLRND